MLKQGPMYGGPSHQLAGIRIIFGTMPKVVINELRCWRVEYIQLSVQMTCITKDVCLLLPHTMAISSPRLCIAWTVRELDRKKLRLLL